MSFADRILPAPLDGGFRMDGYWTWCASVIRADHPGEDGRYHMMASRWPKTLSFSPCWVTNSQVVHASSDRPEGPYQFESVALPWRHRRYFDGLATHNPQVREFAGLYYLYYTGITYDFDVPTAERPLEARYPEHQQLFREAWNNKRIGLAVSETIAGPWQRPEAPLLLPRPDKWDKLITSNPSVAIRDDGFSVMVYKSRPSWQEPMKLGIATAPHPAGPFVPVADEPTFPFEADDPYVWWQDGRFHVIMKDFHGEMCGETYGGAYATSEDGLDWRLAEEALAYSRLIHWQDGTSSRHARVERPSLLLQEGKPTHLFLAISENEEGFHVSGGTHSICLPLRQE